MDLGLVQDKETTGLRAQGPIRDLWALLAATPHRSQPSTQVCPWEGRDPCLHPLRDPRTL